ncbi:MAG: transposase [Candidatus Heimdallarchaeota archaeon]
MRADTTGKIATTGVITRRFGLTPVVRCPACQTECQKIKEVKRKTTTPRYSCPTCTHEIMTPLKIALPPDFFLKIAKATNAFIQAGIGFPATMFHRESIVAVKYFYNEATKCPGLKAVLKALGLQNRLLRCAAQYAYFALREYRRRGQLIAILAQWLVTRLQNTEDLILLAGDEFPSVELVQVGRQLIREQLPTYGSLSTPFLQNIWRHVRNLLRRIVVHQADPPLLADFKEFPFPKEVTQQLLTDLRTNYTTFLKSFLRSFSRRLTRRLNKIVSRQQPAWGQGFFDPLLTTILEGTPAPNMTLSRWEGYRRKWRQRTWTTLLDQLSSLPFPTLLAQAEQQVRDDLSVKTLLRMVLHPKQRKRLFWYTNDVLTNWHQYLGRVGEAQLWDCLVAQILPMVLPLFQQSAQLLSQNPWKWLRTPCFKKQAVSFGPDDGQAFKLWMFSPAEAPDSTSPRTVYVRLTIAPRRALDFRLNTPERFLQFLSDGWTWKKPVLSKSSKGTLVLAIPFALPEPESEFESFPSERTGARDRTLSVDLGLKTLATLSVVEGVAPLKVERTTFTTKAYRSLFHDHNIGQAELARYFLDQPQLAVPARNWFRPSQKSLPPTNFKRKLYHLQQEARRLRSLLTRYRNRHRPTYKQKMKYNRLRRAWKRVWRQLKALHTEMAQQLALRILTVAQYHQVRRIRIEDLSWARHSAKADSGYWLATWQVHWFYAQIQDRVANGATRLGIQVEWVNPRETSKRCSRCGRLGQRPENGKAFHCPHCGIQLDSDLNAARNLHLVPSSPVAICDRVRAPVAALH